MPSKRSWPDPRLLVILEDIRSQNRATLAAVEASRVALLGRIDRFEQRLDSWFDRIEAALQSTKTLPPSS